MRSIVALLMMLIVASKAVASDCEVTMAQYQQLRTGMSIAQATTVLGCEGVEMSSNEIAGIKTIMFMWDGTSIGANMNAMFQDDQLVQKAQFGLK